MIDWDTTWEASYTPHSSLLTHWVTTWEASWATLYWPMQTDITRQPVTRRRNIGHHGSYRLQKLLRGRLLVLRRNVHNEVVSAPATGHSVLRGLACDLQDCSCLAVAANGIDLKQNID